MKSVPLNSHFSVNVVSKLRISKICCLFSLQLIRGGIIKAKGREMKRKIITLLLVIHGLITLTLMFYVDDPMGDGVGWNGTSWLLTGTLDAQLVQIVGSVLWATSAITFVLAGIALFTKREQWRLIDIVASLVSLVTYLLFWNGLEPVPEYYILGPVISIVTLVALVVVRWPSNDWIFGPETGTS